jgi:hypothetical protein
MSNKYVHPDEESVQIAMEGVAKHKTGYKPQKARGKKKIITEIADSQSPYNSPTVPKQVPLPKNHQYR